MAVVSARQKLANIYARFFQKPFLMVPLPQPIARFLVDLSALVYATPRDLTLRPETLGGVPCTWCGRKGQARKGVLLYLHGGAFLLGSLRLYRHLIARLGAKAGLDALFVDYRLAPEHPFPAAPEDALAVYRALLAAGNAPEDIRLAGDSAGGTLTLSLLHLIAKSGLPMPCAVALLSPLTDLSLSSPSIESNRRTEKLVPRAWGARGVAAYLAGHDPRDPCASPLFSDMTGWPPTLIHVADEEILRDDSLRLAEALRGANVPVKMSVWKGVPHVWHIMAGRVPEADLAVGEIANFLRAPAV